MCIVSMNLAPLRVRPLLMLTQAEGCIVGRGRSFIPARPNSSKGCQLLADVGGGSKVGGGGCKHNEGTRTVFSVPCRLAIID